METFACQIAGLEIGPKLERLEEELTWNWVIWTQIQSRSNLCKNFESLKNQHNIR